MSTRIAPRRREPPAVSWASRAVDSVSCEIFPSFIMISPNRSSRSVSVAWTIFPRFKWICAVAASERMVMTPLFSPFAIIASSSGRLRSRKLPTSAIVSLPSSGGNLILAGLLCGVERDVGGFEQLPGRSSAIRECRHTHADRDRAGVHERKRPRFDRLLDAFRKHARAFPRRLGQDHHEFVAAVLCHEIDRARLSHERLSHELQHFAPAQVSMPVVV